MPVARSTSPPGGWGRCRLARDSVSSARGRVGWAARAGPVCIEKVVSCRYSWEMYAASSFAVTIYSIVTICQVVTCDEVSPCSTLIASTDERALRTYAVALFAFPSGQRADRPPLDR